MQRYAKRSLPASANKPARSRQQRPRASAIGRALQLLGDRWTLLILREAFYAHTRRFQAWRDALGISDPVLAARLKDLIAGGVLEQVRGEHGRREYRLTGPGLELWAMLVAIWAWERRWVDGRADVLPRLRHLDCNRLTDPVLVCAGCGEQVTARDTSARLGPSGQFELAAPPRFRRRSSKQREPADPQLLFPETMAVLGDRWCAVLLGAAFLGRRRFVDFERDLGISPTLLSERLTTLVRVGILSRGADREYRLTAKGMGFFPIYALLVDWAERHLAVPAGPGVVITHRWCGKRLAPALACDRCGDELERRTVRFLPAPKG
jgi:DNA-binding HxlR family transcriptional regulator